MERGARDCEPLVRGAVWSGQVPCANSSAALKEEEKEAEVSESEFWERQWEAERERELALREGLCDAAADRNPTAAAREEAVWRTQQIQLRREFEGGAEAPQDFDEESEAFFSRPSLQRKRAKETDTTLFISRSTRQWGAAETDVGVESLRDKTCASKTLSGKRASLTRGGHSGRRRVGLVRKNISSTNVGCPSLASFTAGSGGPFGLKAAKTLPNEEGRAQATGEVGGISFKGIKTSTPQAAIAAAVYASVCPEDSLVSPENDIALLPGPAGALLRARRHLNLRGVYGHLEGCARL